MELTLRDRRNKRQFDGKNKRKKFLNISIRTWMYILLVLWAIVCLFPFVWGAIAPMNNYTQIRTLGINPIPKHWTLDNYKMLFQDPQTSKNLGHWLFNSFFYGTLNATLNVFFNFLAGYALARIKFKGKNLIFWYFILGTMIPAQVTQIPQLIILINLGTVSADTNDIIFLMSIVMTGMTSATWIFLSRQFYLNIGVSAEEAGALDGLSTFGAFFRISLRQMLPLMATMWTMIFMFSWNNYVTFTLMAGRNENRQILTSGLSILGDKVGHGDPDLGLAVTLAATNIVVLPLVIVYITSLFFQRGTLVEGEK